MCGVNRDCIYTQGGIRDSSGNCAPNGANPVSGATGVPNSRDDSVLLPTQNP